MLTVLVLGACSGEEPGEQELPPGVVEGSVPVAPAETTTTPAPAATAADCANEAAIAADPARRLGTAREADIDGDGALDTVALATDPSGAPGCAAFVLADLAGAIVSEPVWEIGREGGLPQPQLHDLVDIDGRPGDEIIVNEAAGASTQFVGAFVYLDGDLARITVAGGPVGGEISGAEDLFPYGGSVGHIEAVDCVDEQVVVSIATPSSDQDEQAEGIYKVERRFYTFDEATLKESDTVRTEVPVDRLDSFPEFGSAPFASC